MPAKIDPYKSLMEQLLFIPTDYEDGWNDIVTPAIIRQRTKEIRDGWTLSEERSRRVGYSRDDAYSIPEVGPNKKTRKTLG